MTISTDEAAIPRPAPTGEPDAAVPDPRLAPSSVDRAWAEGYEIGRLDAQLAARPVRAKVGLTIRTVNRDAAEALARRHAYDLHVRGAAEEGFVWVEFWPRR